MADMPALCERMGAMVTSNFQSQPIRSKLSLAQQVSERIRGQIVQGEHAPGARLPSEAELGAQYGVSRVTIRTATKMLESQGLVDIRHGSGIYVSDFGGQIRTGLQELRSISDTIKELGFTPRTERHSLTYRKPNADEAAKLALLPTDLIAEVERAIYADNEIVAYSYDYISTAAIGDSMRPDFGVGSIFATLDELGTVPVRSLAEIHAVSSKDVGWGSSRPATHLYLLLDQVHFDRAGSPLFYSKTYLVEGRFQFVILRTR